MQDEPGQRVTYATSWNADGDGSDIYAPFSATGRLPNAALDDSNSASALAVEMNLKAHQTETVRFVLAWDFPQITFGTEGDTSWMRRYTSFYGAREDEQNNYIAGSYPGNQGFAIAARNLARVDEAEEAVARWWKPVAFDDTVSPAIRMAALNELGQLTFNGSFWESGLVSTPHQTEGPRPGSAVPGTHLFHTLTGGGWADAGETDVQGQMAIALRELFPSIEADWVRATSEMIAQDPNGRVPGSPGFNPPVEGYHLVAPERAVAAVGELYQPSRTRNHLLRPSGQVPDPCVRRVSQLGRRFAVARRLPGDAPPLDARRPTSDTAGRHAAHGGGRLRQHLRRDGAVRWSARGLQLRPVHPGRRDHGSRY